MFRVEYQNKVAGTIERVDNIRWTRKERERVRHAAGIGKSDSCMQIFICKKMSEPPSGTKRIAGRILRKKDQDAVCVTEKFLKLRKCVSSHGERCYYDGSDEEITVSRNIFSVKRRILSDITLCITID